MGEIINMIGILVSKEEEGMNFRGKEVEKSSSVDFK